MKTLIKTLPLLFVIFAVSGCKNKKKTYTTAKVTEEIKDETETIKRLRLNGKLNESAVKTQELATKILTTYPKATMYREHIIRFLRYAMKISRLCRDRSLELKNESINPEDAKAFSAHADKIDKQLDAIRKNLNSIKWMVPPEPEKTDEDKEKKEDKTEKPDENSKPEEAKEEDDDNDDDTPDAKEKNTDK